MAESKPEVWLRGPVPGVPPVLQPVTHALLQAREEVEALLVDFPAEHLWTRPGGVASAGFHLQHLSGVVDRLFTYARGEGLSAVQREALLAEKLPERPGVTTAELVSAFHARIDQAIEELRSIDPDTLLHERGVGRQKLPSNVLGLLFHAAEHVQRHTGQLLVTVRVQRG